ncbi:MAG: hypothetical protein GY862_29920, partial [Gammaproteobacteria bacterium]|nr:hypothetical protein [Gammaproteobacteria bacterium]
MKNKRWYLPLAMLAATFLSMPATGAENSASLEPMGGCSALHTELKEAAIAEMEARIDASLQNELQWGGMCWRYEDVFLDYAEGASVTSPMPTAAGGAATNAPSAPAEKAAEYSETNVQVTGVDEADFVKNDGKYIYILANGKFRIVESWPAEQAAQISAFDIEGAPKKLFVHEGRAFIYSSLDPIDQGDHYGYYGDVYYPGGETSECTYGYDCEFTGDGRELKITVLDISDVAAPNLLREISFSGAYLNSRRINNAVYSAVIFPEPKIRGLTYWPENYQSCRQENELAEADITAMFENLKAQNRALIESADITAWLPSIKDILYSESGPQEDKSLLESCDNFYRSGQTDGKSLLSIISTDINGTSPLSNSTAVGNPGAVYASASALYVVSKHSRYGMQSPWFFDEAAGIEEASTIHKFSLNTEPPSSEYTASGVVKGSVLNQFSMDEFQGFFRMATTTGHVPNPDTHSTISILEEQSGELVLAGQIDNIAPTEDIRSARFIGDKGYIVTFKKTDPLFVFDLSEPRQPTIAGELKIPGFSTYMHRLDDNHLLTIGYDADDQGSFAWFQGIMLQIFDVSDMANPLLTHKEVIGTRGSTSEAATNHLAFNYFGAKGMLAIPMTVCEAEEGEQYGGSYGDLMTFSGLLVYGVNAETGFELVGGVPHIAPESQDNYRGMCSSWWTQSNSYVKRSVFMSDKDKGDYVYSITEDTIKANNLSAMGTDVSVVYLSDDPPKCDPFHIDQCQAEPDCSSNNGLWEEKACRLPLYSLRSAKVSPDASNAAYDPRTKILNNPCLQTNGTQSNADP